MRQADKKFKEAYQNLNLEQKEAVAAIEGPVMVIAGPGTGKTQILTLRIANILLKTDTQPDSILALTFTEAAAVNMKRRLVSLIGSPGYTVTISTFHKFCNSIISDYPEYFPEIIGSANIDAIKQIEILESIIDHSDFTEIKPPGDKFYYIKPLISQIKEFKNEGLAPATVIEYADNKITEIKNFKEEIAPGQWARMKKKARRDQEAAAAFFEYQTRLRQGNLYDYEDMILLTLKALQTHPDLLLELQEKYQYILVDEHQDTNGAQNQVVELLGHFHDNPNIFVVGDEKQAIYRFQGASLSNFLFFKKKYSTAQLITLKTNYRSIQSILDAASSLIKNNSAGLTADLKSHQAGTANKISVAVLPTYEDEARFIAKSIKAKLAEGIAPNEIAILYRENKDGEIIADALSELGIAFSIESDINILTDPDIKKLINLLSILPKIEESKLAEILHFDFWDINALDLYKLIEASRENKQKLLTVMLDKNILQTAGLKHISKIQKVATTILKLRKRSYNDNFIHLFEKAIKDSGFLSELLTRPDYIDRIETLRSLFIEIKKAASLREDYGLSDFLRYIEVLKKHNLSIKNKKQTRPNEIRLMTAHRAKGLEFEIVFIIQAVDGKWGNKRKHNLFGFAPLLSGLTKENQDIEDERRLFYMALTRAKRQAIISYGLIDQNEKDKAPSQFITEIEPQFIKYITRPVAPPPITAFLSHSNHLKPKPNEKEYLINLFKKRGLSVTALNNYLTCPWRFFYQNLIRIPQAKNVSLSFGTAAHEALNKFFKAKKEGRAVNHQFLINEFELRLKKEYLSKNDFKMILAKGKKILPAYYKNYHHLWNYDTLNEVNFDVLLPNTDIHLTGKLDKIELAMNGSNVVTVVDYKTGKPKTRNDILGKTKNSGGEYFRQLVFYNLLLKNYHKPWQLKEAVLDFLEPLESGKFRKEKFTISEKETKELEELIKKVWAEIVEFKFWNQTCSDKKCAFCELSRHLRKKHR